MHIAAIIGNSQVYQVLNTSISKVSQENSGNDRDSNEPDSICDQTLTTGELDI